MWQLLREQDTITDGRISQLLAFEAAFLTVP